MSMRAVHADGPESQRRAAARGGDAAPTPQIVPAGVSNHLLARALSTGNASATLQRFFQYKGKRVSGDAKMPNIHGASAGDLQKLAKDGEHDYGAITDAASVTAAMQIYSANHQPVADTTPLPELFTGNRTVWTDDAFDQRQGQPVRATFQLDSMQGKHDDEFATGKDARKKGGGEKMPAGTDYAALAQEVPAELARERLGRIFGNGERKGFDFSVQKEIQADGLQYEMSAMWAREAGGFRLLVYYHCYPPRK
jgi:hypothetical protein